MAKPRPIRGYKVDVIPSQKIKPLSNLEVAILNTNNFQRQGFAVRGFLFRSALGENTSGTEYYSSLIKIAFAGILNIFSGIFSRLILTALEIIVK